MQNIRYCIKCHITMYKVVVTKGYSEPYQTSKMQSFGEVVAENEWVRLIK